MWTVETDQVNLGRDGKTLTAEAADLGLTPGEWPDFIAVAKGGEGFLFQKGAAIVVNGQFGGHEYWSKGGTRLSVFND